MDYEKKYKEALEWARKVMQGKVGFVLDEVLEKFPELKESEDERTRKEIITYISTADDKELIPYESWLVWLEKQGKQKLAEWTMDNIEELTEFENAMMHIGGSFFGEHQGLDPNDTFVVKEQAKILLEMAPKQEWSEEDESIRTRCIGALMKCYMGELLPQTVIDEVEWLNSLKEKVQPQNTWKSSDEQMKAFDAVLVYNPPCSNECRNHLITLYSDLKKLKGE